MNNKKLPVHERIKKLRNNKGWSQTYLGEKIGSDGRMIGHYEKGKYVPSAEVLIKLSEIFNVTIDYLLIENAPKKFLDNNTDNELIEILLELNKLPVKDREMIKYLVHSVITKNKVEELAIKSLESPMQVTKEKKLKMDK